MEVMRETTQIRHLLFGHTQVGTVPVRIAKEQTLYRGLLIRAPGSDDPNGNTSAIWIGGANVTADSSATGGMPLPPGSSLFIPLDSGSELWAVSLTDDQDLAFMGA